MIGIQVDAGAAYAAIERKIFGIQKNVQGAARTAGELIAGEVRSRLIQPRRLNVQDSDTPQVGRNPLRLTVESDGVTVALLPHWSNARSKAIFGIYTRQGRARELERAGLWVSDTGKRNTAHGYTSRAGLRYFEFAAQPKLLAWSQRADRGRQFFHHALWLEDVEARKVLQMQPALRKFQPKLTADVIEGVRRA